MKVFSWFLRSFLALYLSYHVVESAAAQSLPKLSWVTPALPESLGSPEATPGGRLVLPLESFPLTLRQVGPDAAGMFRRVLDENDLSLVTLHPNNETWIPVLASAWAITDAGKTVYYRLRPEARWSDGQPLKAKDFLYILEFMRSPHIQSPWSMEYYTKTITDIRSFVEPKGTEVIAITLSEATQDPLWKTNLKPLPSHFYGKLGPDFVQSFNWKIPPNLGPYRLSQVVSGERISFERKKDWWAAKLGYFQHRFMVDEIVYRLIRESALAFEYLKSGDIQVLNITSTELWQQSAQEAMFTKGYLHRLQAYNDMPRQDYAIVLNQDKPLLKDKRVREALAYALPVDRVIQDLLRGDYQRLQGISRGYGTYTNPKIKARGYDPLLAVKLLEEAGWKSRNADGILEKEGKLLRLELIYQLASHSPRMLILQEGARKLGIDLQLKQMEPAMAFKTAQDKAHDAILMAWGTPYRPEYRARFHSSNAHRPQSSNLSNTADPKLDRWIEEYEYTGDEALRRESAHSIQQFIHDEASYIPLFEVPYFRLGYWAWLRFPTKPATRFSDGLAPFDASHGGLFWIDTQRKREIEEAWKKGENLPQQTLVDETWRLQKTDGK